MKMLVRAFGFAVLAVVCISNTTVFAADGGDAIFPIDLKDQTRVEAIYENLDRDVNVTSGPKGEGTFEADTIYLRIHTPVGRMASLDIDLGGLNPKAGEFDYYVGGGIRYLAYDSDPVRVAIFAQLHYSPVEADQSDGKLEYDYVEGEGGVLFNGKINIQDQLVVMPYIGPVISIVRLDGDASFTTVGANNQQVTTKVDFDAEEDTMFGIVFGGTLKMLENHSVRLEARYFDNWNFSAAAGVAF